MSVPDLERIALGHEDPTLLTLPDTVHHTLCAFLDACGCLALRSACHLLRTALTGADADLGVWKPRVLALAPPTADAHAPTVATYEQQYVFLHRYAYLVGDYRWPLPVIGASRVSP